MLKALTPLLALVMASPALAQDAATTAIVMFDSVCLTCHEGECSGRMALRTERGSEGLAGHVAGYVGRQDEVMVSRLKGLMSQLKTECRLPPPPVALPADGIWDGASLAPLTLADRQRLFVPLGPLNPGTHSTSLRQDEPQRLRLQVVADSFDIVFDQDSTVGPTGTRIHWQVEEPGQYFLRIIGRRPVGTLRISP
ncbi:hypothetical protein [Paramagnetospirillum magneticum]|uniref:hypothetical protein n=1 Tax=Paramagnetospirillum magneticum TaxID=84159 RepID=UPI0002FF1A15|nr:hypothetical protein [Paramagnetospirillum magneticum]